MAVFLSFAENCSVDSRWGVQSDGSQVLGQPFGEVVDRAALEGHYRTWWCANFVDLWQSVKPGEG